MIISKFHEAVVTIVAAALVLAPFILMAYELYNIISRVIERAN